MKTAIYIAGMTMGLSLIVPIGAQNAFVLRQGLRHEHVFAVCLTCAVSDAILIAAGVTSFGQIVTTVPWLDPLMRYGGAIFLLWYAMKSARSAMRSSDALLVSMTSERIGLGKTLLTCLAFTWLNPHVYLDTVVLLGTISTQFKNAKDSFAAGAISGSFLFFFSLGYGARWLRPVFARPMAWRVLDGTIALVMASIAIRLVLGR